MSNLGTGACSDLQHISYKLTCIFRTPTLPLKLDEVQAFLRNALPLHLGVPLLTVTTWSTFGVKIGSVVRSSSFLTLILSSSYFRAEDKEIE